MDKFRIEYSDIISKTSHLIPNNYEVINFECLLRRRFLLYNVFVKANSIPSKMNDESFKRFGVLQEVKFASLLYYQKEVGIEGPKHTNSNEGVLIIKNKDQLLLWNGYHRCILRIANDYDSIIGYVLEVPNLPTYTG